MTDEDSVSADWRVELGPDEQSVMVQLNHMSPDGVESFVTGMPREYAIAFAADVLNAALEICICGGHHDEES